MTAAPGPWCRLALAGGGGMLVGMGLGRFSYTAMVPALIAAGVLTPVEAGLVGMANLAGFLIGAAASVWLARKINRTRLLRRAVVIAVLGLAASGLPFGFFWLAAVRAVIGVTTGLIMVHSLALIAETAPLAQRATASGYVFAGVGLGILAAAVLVPWLVAQGLAITWTAVALAGMMGAAIALWGWSAAPETTPLPDTAGQIATSRQGTADGLRAPGLKGLLLAHALFSFGIVPHTLYWVDYLARGQGLGIAAGGWHWSLVGLFAIIGPIATGRLAKRVGTAAALVTAFVLLGFGIALPALWPWLGSLIDSLASPTTWFATTVFVASSVLFGAQPGLSSLMAARARDLAGSVDMGPVMRAMILANGSGGVAAGLLVPWTYGQLGRHEPLFLMGGAAMLLAGAVAWQAAATRARVS